MPKKSQDVQSENPITAHLQCESVKALFGAHPEDVILPIASAAEALSWIEEILYSIQHATEKDAGRNATRISNLAGAAAYIASEFSNYAGYEHEQMVDRLQVAGVVDTRAAQLRDSLKNGGAQ